jgi:hypothetical protein
MKLRLYATLEIKITKFKFNDISNILKVVQYFLAEEKICITKWLEFLYVCFIVPP